MTYSAERMAEWRSAPLRAAIRRWENRTYQAARSRLAAAHPAELARLRYGRSWGSARTALARRYPAEFLRILDGIRATDPRPGAGDGQERTEGKEAA